MKIKPNENYKLLGTNIELSKDTVYTVEFATNIPNWKEKGSVFVGDMLLHREDYTIIED